MPVEVERVRFKAGRATAPITGTPLIAKDNCAPAAVALSHGLHVSRLDGTSLSYNNSDPWLPDLLICHPDLAEAVLNLLDVSGRP